MACSRWPCESSATHSQPKMRDHPARPSQSSVIPAAARWFDSLGDLAFNPETLMTEDQDKNASNPDSVAFDRRRSVKVGATSLGVAGLGACVFGFRDLSSNVLYEPSPVVSVGRPEHYTVGSVTLESRFGIFVVRAEEGFYALSAVCTRSEHARPGSNGSRLKARHPHHLRSRPRRGVGLQQGSGKIGRRRAALT
jgi:hypothetical protein